MASTFRQSYAWKKKRREIHKLYKGKCALCGCTSNCEAHHIIPLLILPQLKLDNNNIILLCSHCHKLAHNGLISQAKLISITKEHT